MRLRLTCFLLIMITSLCCFSQDSSYRKRASLGFNFFFDDFKSAAAIRANPLGSALRDKKLSRIKDMNAGLAISYVKGLCSHVDFAATLGGSFLKYPTMTGTTLSNDDAFLLEGDASLRAKMVSDHYWVVPYLSAGVGASKFKGYYSATAPIGAGIQLNLFEHSYFIISSQYSVKITDNANYHFIHSIGFVASLTGDE